MLVNLLGQYELHSSQRGKRRLRRPARRAESPSSRKALLMPGRREIILPSSAAPSAGHFYSGCNGAKLHFTPDRLQHPARAVIVEKILSHQSLLFSKSSRVAPQLAGRHSLLYGGRGFALGLGRDRAPNTAQTGTNYFTAAGRGAAYNVWFGYPHNVNNIGVSANAISIAPVTTRSHDGVQQNHGCDHDQ